MSNEGLEQRGRHAYRSSCIARMAQAELREEVRGVVEMMNAWLAGIGSAASAAPPAPAAPAASLACELR